MSQRGAIRPRCPEFFKKAHAMTFAAPTLDERLAESARYALLRRLMPAIRHNLAGSLQPIGMVSAMLERRMQGASPDLEKLGKNVSDITELSRDAASVGMNLMTWLAPRDTDAVAFSAGLVEALQLQATELSFRGFSVVNETEEIQTPVRRSVLRSLTIASVLALTDAAPGPAEVVLSARTLDGEILLHIELAAKSGEALDHGLQVYRPLVWDDVKALADAENVAFSRTEDSVELRFLPADAQVG